MSWYMAVLIKGVLDLFILAEAKHGVSGKSLVEKIRKMTDDYWKPSCGSVYPSIRKLERKGFIRAKKSPGKEKSYALTAKGRAELKKKREKIMKESEEMSRTVGPLIMHAVHDLSEGEIGEMKAHYAGLHKIRARMMKLPPEKRRQLTKHFFELIEDNA